ncbi:MAG: putative quinol monooxygenase [Rhizobiaceae bacterium]
MFGLIGKLRCQPGTRARLMAILHGATRTMPGCLSYVVAEDEADADVIWITEVWDNAESHKASLSLAEVSAAIAAGRPLIAGFESQVRTRPFSGA